MTATMQLIPGIIDRQNGPVTGTPPRGDPALVTYDVSGFFDVISGQPASVRLTNATPDRRISLGAKVLVAKAGDPCWIKIVNNQRFLYVNEGIPFVEACP